jgi:hypothetical protein
MNKLYKVEEIIILNFYNDYSTFAADENYPADYRKRVKAYVDYMLKTKRWTGIPTDEKQVFILSKNPVILPKKPKPKNGNNSFRAYYELADLLNKELV